MSYSPTIAIDFDGTLTKESKYPLCGEMRSYAVDFVRNIHYLGYRIVLWTCRKDDYFKEALSKLKQEDIYDCFDWNYLEDPTKFGENGKILASFYVDDRSMINVDLDSLDFWEDLEDHIILKFPVS